LEEREGEREEVRVSERGKNCVYVCERERERERERKYVSQRGGG